MASCTPLHALPVRQQWRRALLANGQFLEMKFQQPNFLAAIG